MSNTSRPTRLMGVHEVPPQEAIAATWSSGVASEVLMVVPATTHEEVDVHAMLAASSPSGKDVWVQVFACPLKEYDDSLVPAPTVATMTHALGEAQSAVSSRPAVAGSASARHVPCEKLSANGATFPLEVAEPPTVHEAAVGQLTELAVTVPAPVGRGGWVIDQRDPFHRSTR
jgi:hypothetical protein